MESCMARTTQKMLTPSSYECYIISFSWLAASSVLIRLVCAFPPILWRYPCLRDKQMEWMSSSCYWLPPVMLCSTNLIDERHRFSLCRRQNKCYSVSSYVEQRYGGIGPSFVHDHFSSFLLSLLRRIHPRQCIRRKSVAPKLRT